MNIKCVFAFKTTDAHFFSFRSWCSLYTGTYSIVLAARKKQNPAYKACE